MLWDSLEKDKEILKNQYNDPVYGEGLPFDVVRENAVKMENNGRSCAEIIKYVLSNCRVYVLPEDFFADGLETEYPLIGTCLRPQRIKKHFCPKDRCQQLLYYTGDPDFSHTSPDWQNILTLGLSGLKARAMGKDGDFYRGIITACEGAEIYFLRLAEEARRQTREKERMEMVASALEALTVRPPQNTHEALQLMYLFFVMQSQVESSHLRSFGSLDMLLYPFFERDIAEKTFTKAQIRTLIRYFIIKLDALKVWANQPFALGGTKGQPAVNELSYIILEEFLSERPAYAKVHIRYSPQMPDDFITSVLKSIRAGGNSLVFINNSIASRALQLNGQEEDDAVDYGIVGCYEIFSQGKELPCSCNGRINLLKAVEAAIFSGADGLTGEQVLPVCTEPESFDEFYQNVRTYLKIFIDNTVNIINTHEKGYSKTHSAPFLSMSYDSCMEKGLDIYSGGAKYNSSSINILGTASAADSIYAVKYLVFDKKLIALSELKNALKNSWQGYEKLRSIALTLPKYGNNIDEVDIFARQIQEFCAQNINKRPNGHGGTYRMGTFSIDWRMAFGEKTCASADGRLSGEPLSKNICASTVQDKRGVTAHILSALKLDSLLVPNGTVLDIPLHHSAVAGEDGLAALRGTLDTYMALGGFAIQYNVFDPQTLKDAQKAPEKYSNLQVRLCGWNAPFVLLTKKEQDEFILQSENI